MTNKTRIQMGVKVLSLVLWGLAIIATCAGLWNAAAGAKSIPGYSVHGFYIVASVVALAINVVAIVVRAKSVAKHYEHD